MQVYLAAAMTNPDRDLAIVQALLAFLEAAGHTVPTRHVADPNGRAADEVLSDRQLARRDLEWLAASDAVIAEVTTPSHGVGVEVTAAAAAGTPVLLLFRQGARVSRLLRGLEGVESRTYASTEAALDSARSFLAALAGALRPPRR